MTNTFFVIEVYFLYDQAKWSWNWSQKGMPRGTAHAGYWRGKARADMDMMTWLFDTAPCVALWFVHVSSSEWSTCRAAVCPRVIFGWATFSFLVGPRVSFRLRHMVASKCTTCLFPVSLSIHIQFTGDRNFCIYNIFIWHKAYNRRHKHVLDSQDNHVHRRHNHVHRRHIRLSRTQDKFRSDSSTSLQVPAKQNFQEEADPSKIPWQPAIRVRYMTFQARIHQHQEVLASYKVRAYKKEGLLSRHSFNKSIKHKKLVKLQQPMYYSWRIWKGTQRAGKLTWQGDCFRCIFYHQLAISLYKREITSGAYHCILSSLKGLKCRNLTVGDTSLFLSCF
jgi:hypothetical protein